jgi:hypothetical protein
MRPEVKLSGRYSDNAAAIEALPERNRAGTLRIWGEWFGRPMDNVHICQSCTSEHDYITLHFDNKERLRVWNPSPMTTRGCTLIIATATKVRWEWYYYGRPQLPENLMFNEYELNEKTIAFRSNRSQGRATGASVRENAVELVGL